MSDGDAPTGVRIPPQSAEGFDVRDPLPRAIRDPSFPAAVRGYERRAVDAYVERVNRLIAELQVAGSPRAAVRHALERVGEQTSGILQRARETAEEITTSAREEAEETTARARAEGEEIVTSARREAGDTLARARADAETLLADARAEADEVLASARDESESTLARARVDAEGRIRSSEEEIASLQARADARMHALQADMAAIADERRALIAELHRIGERLGEIVAEGEPARDDAPADPAPVPAMAGGADDTAVAED
ncbi:MAG TPA: DivIVA domain-containing protein [Solirubrobacteraceae bacterium]|nr:DivIVA domain-containing protein [Solirubrobacteraceae bacterium]